MHANNNRRPHFTLQNTSCCPCSTLGRHRSLVPGLRARCFPSDDQAGNDQPHEKNWGFSIKLGATSQLVLDSSALSRHSQQKEGKRQYRRKGAYKEITSRPCCTLAICALRCVVFRVTLPLTWIQDCQYRLAINPKLTIWSHSYTVEEVRK